MHSCMPRLEKREGHIESVQHSHTSAAPQPHRQVGSCTHAYRHTGIQAFRHTCRHAYRHTDIQTYIHTYTYIHTHTYRYRYRYRYRQTHRHTHPHPWGLRTTRVIAFSGPISVEALRRGGAQGACSGSNPPNWTPNYGCPGSAHRCCPFVRL